MYWLSLEMGLMMIGWLRQVKVWWKESELLLTEYLDDKTVEYCESYAVVKNHNTAVKDGPYKYVIPLCLYFTSERYIVDDNCLPIKTDYFHIKCFDWWWICSWVQILGPTEFILAPTWVQSKRMWKSYFRGTILPSSAKRPN